MASNRPRLVIVYGPSGWANPKNALALHITSSVTDAEIWMKENHKEDCPIYSYNASGKNLSDEKLENPKSSPAPTPSPEEEPQKASSRRKRKEKETIYYPPRSPKRQRSYLFLFLAELIIGCLVLTLKVVGLFLGGLGKRK